MLHLAIARGMFDAVEDELTPAMVNAKVRKANARSDTGSVEPADRPATSINRTKTAEPR